MALNDPRIGKRVNGKIEYPQQFVNGQPYLRVAFPEAPQRWFGNYFVVMLPGSSIIEKLLLAEIFKAILADDPAFDVEHIPANVKPLLKLPTPTRPTKPEGDKG